MEIDLEVRHNQTHIALMVGKTQPAIRKLLEKCHIPSEATNGEAIEAIFTRLSNQAAGRGGEDQKLLTKARIASELAKAESLQLANFEKKGQLFVVEDFLPLIEQWSVVARSEVQNMVNKLVSDIEGLNDIEISQELKDKYVTSAFRVIGAYPLRVEKELASHADGDDSTSSEELGSSRERTNT